MTAVNPEELPCVWTLAGVLAHRPCHRSYECDGCALFHALRGEGPEGAAGGAALEPASQVEEAVSLQMARLTAGCALHLDRPYTREHFWIQGAEADGGVLVGLDAQALRILLPLDDLVLPKPGAWLKRGEAMGWALRGHLVLPLVTPLSGEVLEVNETLVREVQGGAFPPEEERWLLLLRPHEAVEEVPGLLRGEEMVSWYQGKLALLRSFLAGAASPAAPQVGRTLNDGGEPNPDLEEVLGSAAFQELVDRIFRRKE